MTRIGKIGRLPHHLRNQLNRRLQDSEPGTTLVEWLNSLPGVQETLQKQFGGRPVTEQNVSDWKKGDYQDWLRHEESRQIVSTLAEQQRELDRATGGVEISDRFASLMSVELVVLTRKMLEETTDTGKRWERLCEVLRELSQLRRDDHRGVRTAIKRSHWERDVEREDEEKEKRQKKEFRQWLCAPFWARLKLRGMAEVFGGGETGAEIAAFIAETNYDLPPGSLGQKSTAPSEASPVQSNPTESNPIQPNPTA